MYDFSKNNQQAGFFSELKILSEQFPARSNEENTVSSLSTLQPPQALFGVLTLIFWRLLTVHLLWGLHLLLCWWCRLCRVSPTPPNPRITPHRGDQNGHPRWPSTSGNVVTHSYHSCHLAARENEGAEGCPFLLRGMTADTARCRGTEVGSAPRFEERPHMLHLPVVRHRRQQVTPTLHLLLGAAMTKNIVAFILLGMYI